MGGEEKMTIHRLDPKNYDWVNNDNIFSWRQFLKQVLLWERKYCSDYSGKRFRPLDVIEMHEGLVTRANVPKSISWQYLIYHPYNCFLLTHEEHEKQGHKREWALQRSYELYGRENVIKWFESLPFRVRPFRLL